MTPEDIPEDRKESYHCPECMNGSVTEDPLTGNWICDSCDFGEPTPEEDDG